MKRNDSGYKTEELSQDEDIEEVGEPVSPPKKKLHSNPQEAKHEYPLRSRFTLVGNTLVPKVNLQTPSATTLKRSR